MAEGWILSLRPHPHICITHHRQTTHTITITTITIATITIPPLSPFPLPGRHTIGFQHNTISGNREVYLDGKELYKSGWMFKLVGTVNFKFETLGKKHVGQIKITVGGMNYMYVYAPANTCTRHATSAPAVAALAAAPPAAARRLLL